MPLDKSHISSTLSRYFSQFRRGLLRTLLPTSVASSIYTFDPSTFPQKMAPVTVHEPARGERSKKMHSKVVRVPNACGGGMRDSVCVA
jgi:hypothetical protein